MLRVLPVIFLVACASAPAGAPAGDTAPASAAPSTYGETLPAQAPVELTQVLADPDRWANQPVVVDGTVKAVCQTRGCWMELAAADGRSCRVVMKGHAFFVPRESAGTVARVAGVVSVKPIPAEQVAHMESEGGSFPGKLADGSAREVRIVASGVELRP